MKQATTYKLLGGTAGIGSKSNPSDYILTTKDSGYGRTLMQFLELGKEMQGRLLGYMMHLVLESIK